MRPEHECQSSPASVSSAGHTAVALAARAKRLLERPAQQEQVEEVRYLLTEVSGVVLLLETELRRLHRRLDTAAGAGTDFYATWRRMNRIRIELEELETVRAPLRRRRTELGA